MIEGNIDISLLPTAIQDRPDSGTSSGRVATIWRKEGHSVNKWTISKRDAFLFQYTSCYCSPHTCLSDGKYLKPLRKES